MIEKQLTQTKDHLGLLTRLAQISHVCVKQKSAYQVERFLDRRWLPIFNSFFWPFPVAFKKNPIPSDKKHETDPNS